MEAKEKERQINWHIPHRGRRPRRHSPVGNGGTSSNRHSPFPFAAAVARAKDKEIQQPILIKVLFARVKERSTHKWEAIKSKPMMSPAFFLSLKLSRQLFMCPRNAKFLHRLYSFGVGNIFTTNFDFTEEKKRRRKRASPRHHERD